MSDLLFKTFFRTIYFISNSVNSFKETYLFEGQAEMDENRPCLMQKNQNWAFTPSKKRVVHADPYMHFILSANTDSVKLIEAK